MEKTAMPARDHPASKAIFEATLKRYRRDITKIKAARLSMITLSHTPIIDKLLAGEDISGIEIPPVNHKYITKQKHGKWKVSVFMNGGFVYVGTYSESDDAIDARDKYLEKNGFVLDSDQKLCMI
jgi:hypothetical protein